jgi:hypothetical protein
MGVLGGEEVGEGSGPDRWAAPRPAAARGRQTVPWCIAWVACHLGRGGGMLMGGPSNCAGFKNTQMGQISSNLNFKLIQTLTSPKMTFPCFKNLK